ncbi:HPr kinase/phosphorylase [Qipengyuania vesicularis]|uniref:HPr kinase/phosphorylase n=1 Tax=Qipengyuania vesicularis TaxID=2867232 RepID=UPI001C86DC39|nr:hypothetical protein [Qipengyuania vesicularis]MBX7526252.1 hypothetical protein [Qipengyuania vesicularis]
MTGLYHYRHSGLLVASELELPEWAAFACSEGEPDVRIVISDDPCPDCPVDGSVAVGETLRFAIEGIGGWQVESGRIIRLHPGVTSDLPELRLFTLGSAWGALGYQRGFAMWHGSAVERDGRAILFCGDSGAGKSTMAAALCQAGAKLVADDLSRIEPAAGGVLIHPSSARIKLWREAIDHLGWQDRILQRDYYRDDKFHCSANGAPPTDTPIAVAALVSLEEGEATWLERLHGREALGVTFRQTMYRPEMVDALGLWGEQGALASRIVADCPAYRLIRPKSYSTIDGVCRAVEPLWGE